MINIEDNGMFEIFPAINTISDAFEYQNAMLNKIVLTGKINALEIAENLFNFTEQTAKTFTELQSQIISSLIREYREELFSKSKMKSKIAINTLKKNLTLRKLDIEVLSKDKRLKQFIDGKISKTEIREFLNNFLDKYSIYSEILIVDEKGRIKTNTNLENRVKFTKDSIFSTLKTDEVVIKYGRSDMFIKERSPFFYVSKIENTKSFLVVCFKFKEETDIIFKKLITENEIITFLDKRNNILASSEKGMDKSFFKGVKKCNESVISNSTFYVKVADENEEFYAVTSYKKRNDINVVSEFYSDNTQKNNLAQLTSNKKELQKLVDDGYSILEDLSDVIINGELIAAKSKQYILIPILDNLREVSVRIVKLIELSISNLQKIIDETMVNNVKILSKFVADTIVRNMYERCNDIKWWAMFVAKKLENKSLLSNDLKYLNDLYQNYSDIFIYNENSEIISISNSTNLIGEKIEHNYTNSNKDANKCFVSEYMSTKLYDKNTYMYYATILDNDKIIGGIGSVLDIQKEIGNILNNLFTDKKGIALIVDKNKNIIFSTDDKFKNKFDLVELKDGYLDDVKLDDINYKISISQTSEYREYKNDSLFVVILMEK